jgi:hypothetical protein
MSWQRNTAYEGSLCRIDHGKTAGGIAHYQVSGTRIEPDIIGIIAEIYYANGRQFGAVEQAQRAVASARNRQHIGTRRIGDTLWAQCDICRAECSHYYNASLTRAQVLRPDNGLDRA